MDSLIRCLVKLIKKTATFVVLADERSGIGLLCLLFLGGDSRGRCWCYTVGATVVGNAVGNIGEDVGFVEGAT